MAATPGRWLLSSPAKVAAIICKQLEHATSKHNRQPWGCWLLVAHHADGGGGRQECKSVGNFPHYPLGESTLKMMGRGV